MSLDIRGAFDSVWWGGLLQHLWSVGLSGKAYYLLHSYLCDRSLFVFVHGDTSSQQPFTVGVPQGGIWSSILLNLYIRYLPTQILHCALLQYADDSTLIMVVSSKDNRVIAADEMSADLARIYSWGRMWNINFEPAKSLRKESYLLHCSVGDGYKRIVKISNICVPVQICSMLKY